MSFPLFIVNKYIKSNKYSFLFSFVSMITIGGIALGVTVVILALSILDGFDSIVSEKIVNFNSHIIVSGYSDSDLPDDSTANLIKKILSGDLESYSKFIEKNALIKSKFSSEGLSIYGIEPNSDNLDIDKMIISGSYFSPKAEAKEIIIGKKLAEKLRVKVGRKITLFSLQKNKLPSYENPPVISQFLVVGIYESGMSKYDDLRAYISLPVARKIFKMKNKISGYNIRLKSLARIDEYLEILKDKLRYPYYIRSIFQEHRNIFTWIELQKKPIPIVLGLIVLVAIFNIVGTTLMNILERTKEIGVLKSLGASRKQIFRIFLIQGTYLGVVGIVLGLLFAFGLSELQLSFNIIHLPESVYFLNSAPIKISFINYFGVAVIAYALALLSSLIPSYIASKIEPISAIKFD